MTREYTETEQFEFLSNFREWAWTERAEGKPYPAEADWRVVCARAAEYGAPAAISAFHRAFRELVAEKVIKPLQLPIPIEIDQEFRDSVTRMPSGELLKKINRDPLFKQKFDLLSAESATAQVDTNPYKDFSARDWKTIPASRLTQLMNNRAFRDRVDHIVAHGDQNGERI